MTRRQHVSLDDGTEPSNFGITNLTRSTVEFVAIQQSPDSPHELTQLCIPLRAELDSLRKALVSLQSSEEQTLTEYRDTEIHLERIISRGRSISKSTSDSFSRIIQSSKANHDLRQKLLRVDHSISFRISDAQRKMSDALFQYDGDLQRWRELKRQLAVYDKRLAELRSIFEAMRCEYTQLALSEKLHQDHHAQLKIKLDDQKRQLDELTVPYSDLKARFEILREERKQRESGIQKRLERARAIRDGVKDSIADLKREQDEYRAKIEVLEEIQDDLVAKRDRLTAEVGHLIELSGWRKAQSEQLAEFAPSRFNVK
jgi:chromosome segregation ATPase